MKVLEWIKQSNRWKHLLLGMAVGAGANSWYCAGYVGLGVAGALEFKDKAHGGLWDWIDWACTVVGVTAGYAIRAGMVALFKS